MLPSPVIVIPGITASTLHDEYELPPQAVWTTVRRKRYDRITPHPDDQRYELREPARVVPFGPFPFIYEDLIEELRDGLSDDVHGPVPVFPFGYDWRLPLDVAEKQLANFIDEVIDRTLLTRHYRDSPFAEAQRVTLVGHSMGGLIIAGYIQSHKAQLVDKVVTLGSPFQGSPEAIVRIVTGTADLGGESGKARERRTARMTPSLYHLLPSYADALAVDDGLTGDIFKAEAWQPSVERSIERQVQEWHKKKASDLFQEMLEQAGVHRERISALNLKDAGLEPNRWLAIAGVDKRTRVALHIRKEGGTPRFDLRSDERLNEWDSQDESKKWNTGDGTVPLRGAVPPFLDREQLVCVTPRDFGYFELLDRGGSLLAGLHAMLPKMNMLHRLIIRFLPEKDDLYGNTWGRRPPEVPETKWPLDLKDKREQK